MTTAVDTAGGPTCREAAVPEAHRRAARHPAAGQICLTADPLLTEPLHAEHLEPRLLGRWNTSPGLNLVSTDPDLARHRLVADITDHLPRLGHRAAARQVMADARTRHHDRVRERGDDGGPEAAGRARPS